jgi:hypothetical protein
LKRKAIGIEHVYTPTPPNSLWIPVREVLPNDQTNKNVEKEHNQKR